MVCPGLVAIILPSLYRFSDESHVADDVEQLVSCTLVFPHQRLVLYVAEVVGVAVFGV